MATIPIFGRAGIVAYTLVDEEDALTFGHLRLNLGRGGYAAHYRSVNRRVQCFKLHRTILAAPRGMVVDHINHDPLDNRRANLRLCTSGENSCNRTLDSRRNRTGFKGVSHNGFSFQAVIGVSGKSRYLGSFATAIEAACRYDEAAIELHGDFALLNFAEVQR